MQCDKSDFAFAALDISTGEFLLSTAAPAELEGECLRLRPAEILIAEGENVAAHFRCSGTQLGDWMGHPPTGRHFQDVDEIYIFRVTGGKLVGAFGVEDNLARIRQLGFEVEGLSK